tara:strand:+ start:79 stop:381 length:303 start_codon:yes stop_codon:yes gene_type:complete
MSKMSEIDIKRQEVEEVMSNEAKTIYYCSGVGRILVPIYYTIDDETGITHYDTDSMRDEFDKEIAQLEANEQAELDGWNEKQQDYAMDSMTCDMGYRKGV